MPNHENEITRFSFTEDMPGRLDEAELRKRFPGFYGSGPERFSADILNGDTYFNVVDTFVPFFLCEDGIYTLTGVRQNLDPISNQLRRQGHISSSITIRRSHAQARDLMNAYSQFRVPILGGEIGDEGFDMPDPDPRNPVLVADHKPGAKLEGSADDMLSGDVTELMDKAQPDGFNLAPYGVELMIDRLFENAEYWPGPTLMGVSEVSTYFDETREAHPNIPMIMPPIPIEENPPAGGRSIMEAHIFTSKVVVVDRRDLTSKEVLGHFPYSNEHYYHFDLAPVDQFLYAVKKGIVDLISPNFRENSPDAMLYIMVCARGMCLRTAAAALARHIAYIRKRYGYDEPADVPEFTYEDGLYRPPMKLTLPAARTIIDLSNRSRLHS